MAYSVDDISAVESWTAASYAADDGTLDVDVTTCMTNGTLAESCDEFKEGTINCRVDIDVDPATIDTFSIRFYMDDSMSAGDNAVLPYTDANSVSTTNEEIQTYDTDGQWYEHVLSAAFIAELADQGGGTCSIRLSSSDASAKSKLGEVETDIVLLPAGPVITDAGDEDFDHDETNITLTGTSFGPTETGSAKVELVDNVVYASGTKVTQSIDTWADTSIQFDLSATGLAQDNLWLYVTDASGTVSAGWPVTVHLVPTITNAEDEDFTVYETDIVLTGTNFYATQSTGKLELGDSATYGSATLVTQVIDTWGDTSITFDLTIGGLDVESLWLYATNSFGEVSNAWAVTVDLTPTVSDVDTDEAIDSNQTDVVITGDVFLNAQGTGKVELSDNATYASGTKVTQTIDTWANGSIQFDVNIGGFTTEDPLWLWVTNDKGFRQAVGTSLDITYITGPTITDAGDELYELNETDIVATGTAFGATETGSAKIELVNNVVYASGTKVAQSVDTWSDTSIQFDLVIGGLTEIDLYLFVTDSLGETGPGYAVQVYRTPTITNIEDESFENGELGIILDGTYLQSPQGTGKLEISDNVVYASGTKVSQTINSWADAQIDFDLELGAIGQSEMYMWATNDLGRRSLPTTVTITGLPITDGLWQAQSFQASIGTTGLETTIFMQRDE